jgi:hypothetical protein
MQVIRHEAVRNYCAIRLGASAQQLRSHKVDAICLREERFAIIAAPSERVVVHPDIVEIRKRRRMLVDHEVDQAEADPADIAGPPKGGHYRYWVVSGFSRTDTDINSCGVRL